MNTILYGMGANARPDIIQPRRRPLLARLLMAASVAAVLAIGAGIAWLVA